MAVPARKTSKQKKRSRRGHIKLSVPAMHYDATTGEYRLGHRVSPKGFYKGKQVLNETKKKKIKIGRASCRERVCLYV